MNISQMILAEVTPLSKYAANRAEEYATRKREEKKPSRHDINHRDQKGHVEAVAKYKEAWKEDEWLPSREIERRLGMGKCGVSPTLKKWCLDYGILERRPIGGVLHRHIGYEYRWVKERRQATERRGALLDVRPDPAARRRRMYPLHY